MMHPHKRLTANRNGATAKKFAQLIHERDYKGASELLSDDSFMFVTVKFIARSRQEWLERFPEIHSSLPHLDPQYLKGEHCNQVIRIGSLGKYGFPMCQFREITEFDHRGKIASITAERKRDQSAEQGSRTWQPL